MIEINIGENIFNISYLICLNYKLLSQLELKGLKNTKEYYEIIKRIKILVNLENEYYDIYYKICEKNSLNYKNLVIQAYQKLHKQFQEKDIELLLKPDAVIFNQFNTSDLAILKVINKISNYEINSELDKSLNNTKKFDMEYLDALITNVELVKIIDDIESILTIEIENNIHNNEIRKILVEAKYDYYSIFEHNFNIQNISQYKKTISEYMKVTLFKYLQQKISKINYAMATNEKNKRKILLTKINIRAKLLNMDIEDKEILKNIIQESIQFGQLENSYGTKMFMELIDQSNYDIEHENTLGL